MVFGISCMAFWSLESMGSISILEYVSRIKPIIPSFASLSRQYSCRAQCQPSAKTWVLPSRLYPLVRTFLSLLPRRWSCVSTLRHRECLASRTIRLQYKTPLRTQNEPTHAFLFAAEIIKTTVSSSSSSRTIAHTTWRSNPLKPSS